MYFLGNGILNFEIKIILAECLVNWVVEEEEEEEEEHWLKQVVVVVVMVILLVLGRRFKSRYLYSGILDVYWV